MLKIQVQNRRSWNTLVSMTERVWVEFKSSDKKKTFIVSIWIADPVSGGKGKSSLLASDVTIIENKKQSVITCNEMNNEHLTFINSGPRAKLTTWFGLELKYTANSWVVNLDVPACYKERAKIIFTLKITIPTSF